MMAEYTRHMLSRRKTLTKTLKEEVKKRVHGSHSQLSVGPEVGE